MGLRDLLPEKSGLADVVFTTGLKWKVSGKWAVNINNHNKKEAEHFESAFEMGSF